ncbi:MAG TPA: hypothetical protein VGJ15_11925 [Pirellulales bacterium]
MKRNTETKTSIDSAHVPAGKLPHDREQLRRRLLKMILQNEAQRRGVMLPSRITSGAGAPQGSSADLVVFDPDDRIGQEAAAGSTPPKRA